jgi:zinc protease
MRGLKLSLTRFSHFLLLTLLATRISLGASEPKLIYEQDPTLLTTTFEMVVLTGAEDDPSGKAGLANLMSELMLRGTKKKNRTKFQSEIERLGASVGVHTAHDHIIFSGKVIKENTIPLLKIIEDFLLNPAFDKKEFQSLKTEILAEINNRKNQNTRLAGLALRKELYAGTVIERAVEGGVATVSQLTLDDVHWAYNNRVHQGSVIFGIASALKESELKKLVTEMWLKLPDGARKTRKSINARVPQKPTLVVVHKPNTSTGSLIIGQPGITAQEPLRFTLGTANFSFGGEPLVSRLFRTIRAELGWTYFIGSTYTATGGLSYQQGIFLVSSIPSVEYTVKTMLKVRSMWADYLASGLKPEELAVARESQVNSYPFDFDSPEKRLSQKMQSYLYNVPVNSPEEYAKIINGIDNKMIKAALKQKHTADGLVITLVADKQVIEKQLEEEQKNVAPENRLKISKVLTPDEVVR